MRRMLLIGTQYRGLKSIEWPEWQSVNILDYQGLLFDCQSSSFTPDNSTLRGLLAVFVKEGHKVFVILPKVAKQLDLNFLPHLRLTVIPQRGDTIIMNSSHTLFDRYRDVLNGHEIYFELCNAQTGQSIRVGDVVNNIRNALCAQHENVLLFHPPAAGKASKALDIIVSFFKPEFEECQPDDTPSWADDLITTIPGTNEIKTRLTEIDESIKHLEGEREREAKDLETLSEWGQLLWLTGIPLQRLVQKAFRFLDFEIETRPETGHTEDFVAKHGCAVFLIEVTGSAGSITIDKGRQLMEWVINPEFENCQGVLVGNAFAKEPPENRPPTPDHHVFTEALEKYSEKYGFSLVDTRELFRMVCAKLANQPIAMDLVCAGLQKRGVVTFPGDTKQ
jgi:hypothetical protein